MHSSATSPIQGKVAIVTGAAGGLGRAIALNFAAHGATVVACDIHQAGLDALSDALRQQGAHHVCLPCDVSDSAAVAALFDQVCQRFGTVHILVNNAALVPDRPQDEARRSRHYT